MYVSKKAYLAMALGFFMLFAERLVAKAIRLANPERSQARLGRVEGWLFDKFTG